MQRTLAVVLIVALTLPGCAASRATSSAIPVVTPSPDPAIGTFARSLPLGSKVRVELAGRRTLRGTLLQATDDAITVQRQTRVPETPVSVPMRDVQRVTIDAPASSGRAIAISAAVAAGTVIGVLWLIAAVAFSD
jgi:hypothetical protein